MHFNIYLMQEMLSCLMLFVIRHLIRRRQNLDWTGPDHGSDHGSDHGLDHRPDHGPDHRKKKTVLKKKNPPQKIKSLIR